MTSAGAWYSLTMADGSIKKFQPSKWSKLMAEDADFKQRVYQIVDEEIVMKFDKRQGDASSFYEDQEDLSVPVGE
jgi:hypothetical protein